MPPRATTSRQYDPIGEVSLNRSIVANSVYNMRRREGLTLASLAQATNLDKGYLSRIERGQKSPSIATLLKIAQALNVPVGHLFGEASREDAIQIVRSREYPSPPDGSTEAVIDAILPASSGRRLSLFLIEAGVEENGRSVDHPGDEMIYVLFGSLAVDFPDRKIELDTGDCVHFDGHLRHAIRRLGDEPARALIIVAQDLPRRSDE